MKRVLSVGVVAGLIVVLCVLSVGPAKRDESGPIDAGQSRVDHEVRHRVRVPVSAFRTPDSTAMLRAEQRKAPALLPSPSAEEIPGEYVLSFYSSADRDAFLGALADHNVTLLGRLHVGNSVRIRVADRAALDAILRDSPVATDISRNVYARLPGADEMTPMTPDGPYQSFRNQALDWLGLSGDNTSWGRGVTVAVLDNGVVDPAVLRGSNVREIDLVHESTTAVENSSGHGLAVASLIVGAGDHVTGVVPAADILSVKVLASDGVGDSFTVSQGIVEAADAGARVINLSLGTRADSHVLRAAVAYAVSKGATVVAAVGNDAIEGVTYPARYPDVLAVGSVDGTGRHIFFSNRGDVDVVAPGSGVAAAGPAGDDVYFSGTSASAPFVSGVAAGLISENPSTTPAEIISIIQRTADDAGKPGNDESYGDGILNIRRILDRTTSGVYDIAVGRPYLPPPTGSSEERWVHVFGQNRGTEPLDVVELHIETSRGEQVARFYNVGVGETVHRDIAVSPYEAEDKDGFSIVVTARIPRNTDQYPANNSVASRIRSVPLTGSE